MLDYPLIYWNLNKENVLGTIVGTEYQLIDNNVKKLKAKFTELLKRLRENYDLDEPEIKNYKMKIFNIKIQPVYNEKEGIFPTLNTVTLNIPAIYGEQDYGYAKCFLPYFSYSFYYYDEEQIPNLVQHFVEDLMKNKKPEDINKYLLIPESKLEHITIKDLKIKEYKEDSLDKKIKSLKNLTNISERVPNISDNKKLNFFPETVWEQGDKVQSLVNTLYNEKSNTLVIGEQGVGKSVIILDSIKKIHYQNKNEKDNYITFWKTNSYRMISGSRYLGDWQEICQKLVEELEYINGVLWITDFINLFTLGGEGVEDSIASFLLPFIQQKRLQIISEISQNELEITRRLLPSFTESFKTIFIEEMEQAKILKVLNIFSEFSNKRFNIEIEKESLELSYRLLNRYIKYERFPGKIIKFLSQCVNNAYFNEKEKITKDDILELFIEKTGLPSILLKDEETLEHEELFNFFSKRIIGQEEAINKLCSVVKVFKTGLNNPNKPIATMLFAGTTGVGKTASVKALAEYFFSKSQKRDPFIRLDMSEFQYAEQIERLIGGSKNQPSKFIQFIREKPFSVVLFDEIEKANPIMFDILLNVLDEGILVDSIGRITDFRNTIIIMTTNLGSEQKSSIGFVNDKANNSIKNIQSFFRPEFFNRIDYIVNFNSLDKNTIRNIVIKELKDIEKRDGFIKRSIKLKFSDEIIDYLSDRGFDIKYGARPLQRSIENILISRLSKYLLDNPDLSNIILKIDILNNEISIS